MKIHYLNNVRLPGSSKIIHIALVNNQIVAISDSRFDANHGYDGQGSWVVPSLWDEHVHVDLSAMNYSRLDLGEANSAAEVIKMVGEHCGAISRGEKTLAVTGDFPIIIHGGGFRPSAWADTATVAALDEVSCGFPVILISGDAHSGWLNSEGLKLLDLSDQYQGLVAEAPWFAALSRYHELPDYSARMYFGLEKLGYKCISQGVGGIKDMSFSEPVWEGEVPKIWNRVAVELSCYPDRLEQVISAGYKTGDVIENAAEGPYLYQGPLKIITDGSLGTRTAFCHHPYADGSHGISNLRGEELIDICEQAVNNQLTLALHAIGDKAIDDVLAAFLATGGRGSIEHVQLLGSGQAKKMAELGISASIQPAHLLDDYPLAQKIWPTQMEKCYRFKELADSGVKLEMGSDSPVAELNPWLAMAAAVYRGDWQTQRWEWNPHQRISPTLALQASCRYQQVQEGAKANLVLLDKDPLGADICEPQESVRDGRDSGEEVASDLAGRLADMTVNATILAGELVFEN